MRSTILNSRPPHYISENFRTLGKPMIDSLELSLRNNYFTRCPEGYLSTSSLIRTAVRSMFSAAGIEDVEIVAEAMSGKDESRN